MKRFSVYLATAVLLAGASRSAAGVLVAPNAYTSSPGNADNRFPFLVNGGMRYQQVFAASEFSSFGGPQQINEIDLRNGIFLNEAFTATIANIQIKLSTTARAPDALSSTFADNIGPDNTLVYSGSLTLSSTNAAGPGGTHVFDIRIVFQTPFLYDPSAGNLLMDVDNLTGADNAVGQDFFDAVGLTSDPVSRIFGQEGAPGATSGTPDSLGLIAQFQFGSAAVAPEPASLTLLALGVTGLAGYGWRRRASA
jgi:hypothetical protein